MKKQFILLFLIAISFSACEKDDICLSPTTPKLILRFYDAANPAELKPVINLSIWAEGKDSIPNYRSVDVDSVAIPLNTNAAQTIYHLKINNTTGNTADNQYDKITISYTAEEVFVSRSCGFKMIFNSVQIATTNMGWIQSFTPNTLTTIDNETTAHVQIFH